MVRTRLQGSSGGEASPSCYPCGSASATPCAPALRRTTNCGAVLAGASPTLAALYWRPPPPRCLARAPPHAQRETEGAPKPHPRQERGAPGDRGRPTFMGRQPEPRPFTEKTTDSAVRRCHPATAPRCENNSKQAGDSSKVPQQLPEASTQFLARSRASGVGAIRARFFASSIRCCAYHTAQADHPG